MLFIWKLYVNFAVLKLTTKFFDMEIQEIKQRLTMAMVLHYYGLKTDKPDRRGLCIDGQGL